jgi:hypothetical protein
MPGVRENKMTAVIAAGIRQRSEVSALAIKKALSEA